MGKPFVPERPKYKYKRGWGHEGLSPQTVVCSWTMAFQDMNGKPTELNFDLFNDDAPLSIGMDVQRFCKTNFIDEPPILTIRRPIDTEPRTVQLYLSGDSPLQLRRRVLIVPTVCTMLTKPTMHLRPKHWQNAYTDLHMLHVMSWLIYAKGQDKEVAK